jgi:two-component system LytT family sensor kinase
MASTTSDAEPMIGVLSRTGRNRRDLLTAPLAAPLPHLAASSGSPDGPRWQGRSDMRRDDSSPPGPPAWAMAAPWVLCGLISASQAYFLWPPADSPPSFLYDLAWQLPPWLFLAVAAPLIARVARRYPIGRDTWGRFLAPHLLANVCVAVGHVSVAVATGWLLGEAFFRDNSLAYAFGKMLAKGVQTELFTYWLIVAMVHAYDYHRKAREGALVAAHLETALAQAQLEALKMQLHPHFLFNTLHAIGTLVRKHDMQGALRMLSGVGDLLRLALENTGRPMVPLKQELDFLRRYLDIEQIRFSDRLDVHMDIAPDVLDAQVPNLLLQPIVENAIRHGIAPRAAAGRIEVRAERRMHALHIEVRDDGVGLPPNFCAGGCPGVGLRNVLARLQQLYPRAHYIEVAAGEEGGVVVVIEIQLALEECLHDAA